MGRQIGRHGFRPQHIPQLACRSRAACLFRRVRAPVTVNRTHRLRLTVGRPCPLRFPDAGPPAVLRESPYDLTHHSPVHRLHRVRDSVLVVQPIVHPAPVRIPTGGQPVVDPFARNHHPPVRVHNLVGIPNPPRLPPALRGLHDDLRVRPIPASRSLDRGIERFVVISIGAGGRPGSFEEPHQVRHVAAAGAPATSVAATPAAASLETRMRRPAHQADPPHVRPPVPVLVHRLRAPHGNRDRMPSHLVAVIRPLGAVAQRVLVEERQERTSAGRATFLWRTGIGQ